MCSSKPKCLNYGFGVNYVILFQFFPQKYINLYTLPYFLVFYQKYEVDKCQIYCLQSKVAFISIFAIADYSCFDFLLA